MIGSVGRLCIGDGVRWYFKCPQLGISTYLKYPQTLIDTLLSAVSPLTYKRRGDGINNAVLSILRSIVVKIQHLIFLPLVFSLSPAIKFRPVCIFSLPKPSLFSSEHSSTGWDCRCPVSIERERENAENKVLFSTKAPPPPKAPLIYCTFVDTTLLDLYKPLPKFL